MGIARAQLANAHDLPPGMRDKLDKRLDKLQAKLDKRLAKINVTNVDELGEQLGEIGNDIGEEMQGLGEELGSAGAAWAQQLGQQLGQGFQIHGPMQSGDGSFHWDMGDGNDADEDDAPSPSPNPHPHPRPQVHAQVDVHADGDDGDDDNDADQNDDADHGNDDDAVAPLGDLGLSDAQHGEIAKLRADTERQVAAARADVARLSEDLRTQLANPSVTDAQVSAAVDAISAKEAAIRKARILAWVTARRALDAAQRSRVENAAKHH
jgi:hypothetical protein